MSDLAADWEAIKVPSKATGLAADWDSIPVKEPKGAPKSPSGALGSDIENYVAGVGMGATKIGRGAKQLLDIPAEWLEKKFPGISEWSQKRLGMGSAKESAAETQKDINEAKVLNKELEDTKAGFAGDVTGQVAATLVPLGAASKFSAPAKALFNPTTYKAAAATGAAQGAIQPVAEGDSRALNVALGTGAGMAGNALVNTVGRVAQPVAQTLSSAHRKAVEVLENAGIKLDAAQRTGSTFLNKVRSSFSDNPFTAGAQAEFREGQQKAYNAAVLKTVGENADSASPEVMGQARKRINGVFKDVLDRNQVAVTDATLARIGNVQKVANEEEKGAVSNIANRLLGQIDADGNLSGQIAYGIKKDLDRLAQSQDTTLAHHASQLRNAVMDAVHSSLDGADRAAFSKARGEFSNLKRIEGTLDKGGSGDISPAKLAGVMMQKRNRPQSVYGQGPQELVDFARAGYMLLPDRAPNSGTVARAAMQIIPPAIAGGGVFGSTDKEDDYGLTKAGAAGLAAVVAPKAAQAIINNPGTARYLSQGMTGGMKSVRDLLQSPQESEAIGVATKAALQQAGSRTLKQMKEKREEKR